MSTNFNKYPKLSLLSLFLPILSLMLFISCGTEEVGNEHSIAQPDDNATQNLHIKSAGSAGSRRENNGSNLYASSSTSYCDLSGMDYSSPVKYDAVLQSILTFSFDKQFIFIDAEDNYGYNERIKLTYNDNTYWEWKEVVPFCNPYSGRIEAIGRMETWSKKENKTITLLFHIYSNKGLWKNKKYVVINSFSSKNFVVLFNPINKFLEMYSVNDKGNLIISRMKKSKIEHQWFLVKEISSSTPIDSKPYPFHVIDKKITMALAKTVGNKLMQFNLFHYNKPKDNGKFLFLSKEFDISVKSGPVTQTGYYYVRDESNHLTKIDLDLYMKDAKSYVSNIEIFGTPLLLDNSIFAVNNNFQLIRINEKDFDEIATKTETILASSKDIYFTESPVGLFLKDKFVLRTYRKEATESSDGELHRLFDFKGEKTGNWEYGVINTDDTWPFASITRDDFKIDNKYKINYSTLYTSPKGGGEGGQEFNSSCPQGKIATGLRIWQGDSYNGVHGVQLICHNLVVEFPYVQEKNSYSPYIGDPSNKSGTVTTQPSDDVVLNGIGALDTTNAKELRCESGFGYQGILMGIKGSGDDAMGVEDGQIWDDYYFWDDAIVKKLDILCGYISPKLLVHTSVLKFEYEYSKSTTISDIHIPAEAKFNFGMENSVVYGIHGRASDRINSIGIYSRKLEKTE